MIDLQALDQMYYPQYHSDAVQPPMLETARSMVRTFYQMFKPTSVLDVGCSGGAMLRAWKELLVPAIGIDGASSAPDASPGYDIRIHDLRHPLDLGSRFDLITCFDTAEHIEQEFAHVFLKSIVDHMRYGSFLLFGPAPVGQDGLGHVNCQHPVYWIDALEMLGVKLLSRESVVLKAAIREDKHHDRMWWVEKNVMVFFK